MKIVLCFLVFILGCNSSSFLIKEPLNQGCKSQGINACPELLDGTLSFIDGNKPQGIKKIREALAKNSPQQVKNFLGILETIPGTREIFRELNNPSEPAPTSSIASYKTDALLDVDIKNPYIPKLESGVVFILNLPETCHIINIPYSFEVITTKCIKIKSNFETLTNLVFGQNCHTTKFIIGKIDNGLIVPVLAFDSTIKNNWNVDDYSLYILSKDDTDCIVTWQGN